MNSDLLEIDGSSREHLHLTGHFVDGTIYNASANDVYPPHDTNGGELCMRWDSRYSYGYWGDRTCQSGFEFVCQYDCDNIRGIEWQ